VRRIRLAAAGVVAVTLICCAAVTAAIPQPGRFAGQTSQAYSDGSNGTVTMRMGGGGRVIRRFNITWLAACDSGFTPLSQGTRAKGMLGSRGRFRGGGTYISDTGNLAGTGYTATIRNRLRGRFVGKRRAEGTFVATAVLRDAAGRPVSSCASPEIGWSAARR
jgi:hypothetical protein